MYKLIGKLPEPKSGWTPGEYKYICQYNPLEQQIEYGNEGYTNKWDATPYNKADESSAGHNICDSLGRESKILKITITQSILPLD